MAAPTHQRLLRRRAAALALAALGLVAVVLLATSVTGDTRDTMPPPRQPNVPRKATPPVRVALQVGHWKHDELPREQALLRAQHGASTREGRAEWQVNLAIAREAKRLLERQGLAVDLLPATVPPRYAARAFVSIHADGNPDQRASGFRVAWSPRDESGRAAMLGDLLTQDYGDGTGLAWNANVTADMTRYYAFDARRFAHAVSPTTPAVVLETGFLSNPRDQQVIVDRPAIAAAGVASGVLRFVRHRGPA